MSSLPELPALVLGPLAGKPDAAWQQAPPGKWTPAQIVEHLALAIETSATAFMARKAKEPMVRRPTTLFEKIASLFVFGLGRFPPGLKAPERTTPQPSVEGRFAEDHFRSALAKWDAVVRDILPKRGQDLFAKHPRLGDLTIGEWTRFHLVHARHHARQIRRRVSA